MIHCGESGGGGESEHHEYNGRGARDKFGEPPGHISYHDIILRAESGRLSAKLGLWGSPSGKILRLLELFENESRISQGIQPGTEPGDGSPGLRACGDTAARVSDLHGEVFRV